MPFGSERRVLSPEFEPFERLYSEYPEFDDACVDSLR
jgi:hypothetical protein